MDAPSIKRRGKGEWRRAGNCLLVGRLRRNMGLAVTIAVVVFVGFCFVSLLETDIGQMGCLAAIAFILLLAVVVLVLFCGVLFAGGCKAMFS